MTILDAKFRKNKGHYVVQCLLASAAVLAMLVVLDAIANAAIIASLGASAFIVFALPEKRVSKWSVVLGGYLAGVAIGTACHWLGRIELGGHPLLVKYTPILLAALAVGLAIFVMTVTNTEHPPAAGVALGLALQAWSYRTVAVVVVGILLLCLAKRVLSSWLKDLT